MKPFVFPPYGLCSDRDEVHQHAVQVGMHVEPRIGRVSCHMFAREYATQQRVVPTKEAIVSDDAKA